MQPVKFSIVFLLLFNGVILPSFAVDNPIFIGQLPVEDARLDRSPEKPLTYDLFQENPATLQTALSNRIKKIVLKKEAISFELSGYPSVQIPIKDEARLSPTFLVDYIEPIFQVLQTQIEKKYGPHPTPTELEEFVFNHIKTKNYAHGFELASAVAQSKEGDCTEHAVLLTALLRMFGYPARIVMGPFVSLAGQPMAFTHAWAEYYDGSSWIGVDGTRVGNEVDEQYLPISVIEDESISFMMGLFSAFRAMAITKVVIH